MNDQHFSKKLTTLQVQVNSSYAIAIVKKSTTLKFNNECQHTFRKGKKLLDG